jgi:hypothetical protein
MKRRAYSSTNVSQDPRTGAAGGDGGYGRGLWLRFSFIHSLLRGTHTPSFAHSTPLRVKDFLCNKVYISPGDE